MADPFLFSLEFELALGNAGANATSLDRGYAYSLLAREIQAALPWLSDGGNGLFTPGFRFYLDSGAHPELALVETTSPWQFLELKRAAFAVLAAAVERVRLTLPGLVILANNHDYAAAATWGCHENYAIRVSPVTLMRGMVPFLATRHLFAGNGRIDYRGRVLLSSRAPLMQLVTGGSTTSQRALFSTARNEPHMSRGPFAHRLHLICGDAVISELGEFLKVATTALVLAWLQRDPHGADDLYHPCPLRLLKATNILWRASGRLNISRAALAIQRAYCTRIERFIAADSALPSWCGKAVALWSETLSRLEKDPLSLTDRLDPFIKLALFDGALQAMGRSWSDIAGDRDLFRRLALLDVAYHQVGNDGPLSQFKSNGLAHRLLSEPAASPQPPEGSKAVAPLVEIASRLPTRAAPRAALIAALCNAGTGIQCNWNGVWRSNPAGRFALDDPTQTDVPTWEPEPPPLEQGAVAHESLRAPNESPERLTSLMQRLRRILVEPQA